MAENWDLNAFTWGALNENCGHKNFTEILLRIFLYFAINKCQLRKNHERNDKVKSETGSLCIILLFLFSLKFIAVLLCRCAALYQCGVCMARVESARKENKFMTPLYLWSSSGDRVVVVHRFRSKPFFFCFENWKNIGEISFVAR